MNKITKLLSVFVIAGAIGTGVVGAVGCGGKGGDDGSSTPPAHTHEYEYTLDQNDTTKHTVHCKNPGHEGGDTTEGHTWGTDNKCTKCDTDKPDLGVTGVTITTEDGKTIKEGDTVTLEATVATSRDGVNTEVTWNIVSGNQYASIEGNVLTANGIGSVYVEAISVADTSVKSEAIEIIIQERNIYDDLVADTANNIIAENFQDASKYTDGKLPVYTGYSNTTKGLYAWGDGADLATSATITTDTHYVGVADGEAKHVVPLDKDGKKTKTTNVSIVADLGNDIKDIVEGYVELSVDALGTNWAAMALTGKSDTVATTGEVFAIRVVDNNGKMSYRVGGKDDGTIVNSEDITFAVNTKYKVHFTLNMVSGLITVDITQDGGSKKNLCTDVQTNITELKAITFVSSNGGQRLTTIDNLAVNSKEATLEQLKASLCKKVDSYVAAATVDDTLDLAGDNVNTAVAGVKESINSATTAAEAKAVAYTTIDAAIVNNAKASAQALITAMSAEGYTGVALDDLNAAKESANTAIAACGTVAEVKDAYATGKAAVEAVENDTDRLKATANVVLKGADGNSVMKTDATLTGVSGTKVTKAQLDALVVVESGKKITGYYTTLTPGAEGEAGTLSDEITFDAKGEYTLTVVGEAGTTVDLVIYVKIEDKQPTTFVLDSTTWGEKRTIVEEGDKTNPGTSVKIEGTAFTAIGVKNDAKAIKVDSQKADTTGTEAIDCINLGGTIAKDKNALSIDCSKGEVTIVVTYFSGKNADRYISVIDSNGKALGNSSDTKTTANGEPVTATITITLTEDTTILIGSASSGIYISSLSVTTLA